MNRTNHSRNSGPAAKLFGTSTEREAFERSARERADEPETAQALTLTTWTIPIIITVSVCSAC